MRYKITTVCIIIGDMALTTERPEWAWLIGDDDIDE
jgi:hypothetical protein